MATLKPASSSRRRSDPRTADPAKVRLGDSSITPRIPARRSDPRTADPAKVRLGDSSITPRIPSR